ncbi:MAG: helix-turn-helix domain-containing protein [Candidatus Omnitrophica bacterium]|nr:helix-turn-helix domain-containing protein [Candidatus Omnitrophota bacterium]
MANKSKEIMDLRDVAAYLDVHPATIYKYAREGKIPAFKFGSDWRFQRKMIDQWISEKVRYNSQKSDRRKE